ncbi:hypothetical protein [Telmatospirillum siberiense]|nr:hypothetical protein [Telmatospirillum siberiense]
MNETAPDWSEIRQKLSRAQTISDAKARRLALRAVIEDMIEVFEICAPTEWEAHFLLHAIRHVENGYPAVAAEEIASVMKPRPQQTAMEGMHRHNFSGADSRGIPTGGRRQAPGRGARPVL